MVSCKCFVDGESEGSSIVKPRFGPLAMCYNSRRNELAGCLRLRTRDISSILTGEVKRMARFLVQPNRRALGGRVFAQSELHSLNGTRRSVLPIHLYYHSRPYGEAGACGEARYRTRLQ